MTRAAPSAAAARVALWLVTAFYGVLWAGGVVAYVFRGGPDPADWWTAPLFLAIAALLVVVTSDRVDRRWLGAALVLGFLAELIGVRTGWPFGAYAYTDALRPRLLGVPIVISMAWLVLVAFVWQWMRRVSLQGWPAVLAGSAAMVAIDLVVDPVAAGPLRYWTWERPGAYHGIPAQNFAGWFLVSAAIFVLLGAAPRSRSRPGPRLVGQSVMAFFGVIAAATGLFAPAVAAAAVCATDLLTGARPSR